MLVDDPVRLDGGGVRVVVATGGRRLEAVAYGAAGARLEPRLAGERVELSGATSPLGPGRDWLVARRVVGRLAVDEVRSWEAGASVSRAANGLRRTLERGAAHLPDRTRSLLLGVVLGDDRAQPAEVADDFRAAGLTHLQAVSGQNVAFVLVLLGPLLSRLRWSLRLPVTLAAVAFFCLLVRFEPSVRAGRGHDGRRRHRVGARPPDGRRPRARPRRHGPGPGGSLAGPVCRVRAVGLGVGGHPAARAPPPRRAPRSGDGAGAALGHARRPGRGAAAAARHLRLGAGRHRPRQPLGRARGRSADGVGPRCRAGRRARRRPRPRLGRDRPPRAYIGPRLVAVVGGRVGCGPPPRVPRRAGRRRRRRGRRPGVADPLRPVVDLVRGGRRAGARDLPARRPRRGTGSSPSSTGWSWWSRAATGCWWWAARRASPARSSSCGPTGSAASTPWWSSGAGGAPPDWPAPWTGGALACRCWRRRAGPIPGGRRWHRATRCAWVRWWWCPGTARWWCGAS